MDAGFGFEKRRGAFAQDQLVEYTKVKGGPRSFQPRRLSREVFFDNLRQELLEFVQKQL